MRQPTIRKVLIATAAVLAAVVFFLLATLPAAPSGVVWTGDPGLPARTIAGAYHIHTLRSDGSGDRAAVAAAASRAGLAFVILTDHGDATRTPDPPAYVDGVLCIDAVEISTSGGHYVALGLRARAVPAGRGAVRRRRRRRAAGWVRLRSPPGFGEARAGLDGLDDADRRRRVAERRQRVAGRVAFAARARPARLRGAARTCARLDSRSAGADPGAVGRADGAASGRRHCRRMMPTEGSAGERKADRELPVPGVPSYEASFRTFSVRAVLSAPPSGDASADARALLDALRSGRVYTAVDAHRRTSGARLPRGARRRGITDGVGAGAGSRGVERRGAAPLRVRGRCCSATGAKSSRLTADVLELDEARAQGAYRVEVHLPGAPGTPPVPWLVSNPIYFLPPPAPPADPVIHAMLFPDGMSWHMEKDPGSTGTVTATRPRRRARVRVARRRPREPIRCRS